MRKKLFIFVPLFVAFIMIFTLLTPVVAMSESISDKVFRIHILANSDEPYDQELKLMVRDRVLDATKSLYCECKTLDEAKSITAENFEYIENVAQKVVAFNGYDYDVELEITDEYFNTREYDDFTLPAGIYSCLKVKIGKAEGHNWWCVMFPSVCISGCSDDLSVALTEEEMAFVSSDKYIIRFKAVEIYESLKSKFSS